MKSNISQKKKKMKSSKRIVIKSPSGIDGNSSRNLAVTEFFVFFLSEMGYPASAFIDAHIFLLKQVYTIQHLHITDHRWSIQISTIEGKTK
jgi:hypothetical protein